MKVWQASSIRIAGLAKAVRCFRGMALVLRFGRRTPERRTLFLSSVRCWTAGAKAIAKPSRQRLRMTTFLVAQGANTRTAAAGRQAAVAQSDREDDKS
jgi:hypothetical protein